MLNVVNSDEATSIITSHLPLFSQIESVALTESVGRVCSENIYSSENIPAFDRSVVDGYAVKASDTYGCSQSLPAMLQLTDEILMGKEANAVLVSGTCQKIPTGGFLPAGADGVVMHECCEDYNDGIIYVGKPVAVYENIVHCGDDVRCGDIVLYKGTQITSRHIGVLASLGITHIPVFKKLKIGILSTGDEIIPYYANPLAGQIRDINSVLIGEMLQDGSVLIQYYPIVCDDVNKLKNAVSLAVSENDVVVMSGGSSAGDKDAAIEVLSSLGNVHFHGIAIKPGKPTLFATVNNKPVFALPGHPLAAALVAQLFVKDAVFRMFGNKPKQIFMYAISEKKIPSDHGRESIYPVSLHYDNDVVTFTPLYSKSGVVSVLQQADGYIRIDRDCEGINANQNVKVYLFARQI